jgi:8-oxo-dGTP diphosphatase
MFNPIFDFEERPTQLYWQSVYRSISSFIVPFAVPNTAIISFAPDGKIVLIRRKNTESWSLPGGEIAWGESIAKNARRKLAAETDLELVKIKHTAGLYSSFDNSQPHSFSVVLVAEVRGKIKIKDSLEVAEARFFSLNDLPTNNQLIFPRDRHLKNQYISK